MAPKIYFDIYSFFIRSLVVTLFHFGKQSPPPVAHWALAFVSSLLKESECGGALVL